MWAWGARAEARRPSKLEGAMPTSPEERARGIVVSLELWARNHSLPLPEQILEELERLIALSIEVSVDEALAPFRVPAQGDSEDDAPVETASWVVPSSGYTAPGYRRPDHAPGGAPAST